MDSDQFQLGKTKVFIKNPESVCTRRYFPQSLTLSRTWICIYVIEESVSRFLDREYPEILVAFNCPEAYRGLSHQPNESHRWRFPCAWSPILEWRIRLQVSHVQVDYSGWMALLIASFLCCWRTFVESTTHIHTCTLFESHFPEKTQDSWFPPWETGGFEARRFHRPDALPVVQPTASKHWRMTYCSWLGIPCCQKRSGMLCWLHGLTSTPTRTSVLWR